MVWTSLLALFLTQCVTACGPAFDDPDPTSGAGPVVLRHEPGRATDAGPDAGR